MYFWCSLRWIYDFSTTLTWPNGSIIWLNILSMIWLCESQLFFDNTFSWVRKQKFGLKSLFQPNYTGVAHTNVGHANFILWEQVTKTYKIWFSCSLLSSRRESCGLVSSRKKSLEKSRRSQNCEISTTNSGIHRCWFRSLISAEWQTIKFSTCWLCLPLKVKYDSELWYLGYFDIFTRDLNASRKLIVAHRFRLQTKHI